MQFSLARCARGGGLRHSLAAIFPPIRLFLEPTFRQPLRMLESIGRVYRRGREPSASNRDNRQGLMAPWIQQVPANAQTFWTNQAPWPRDIEHCRRDAESLRLPFRSPPSAGCEQPIRSLTTSRSLHTRERRQRLVLSDAGHPSWWSLQRR